MEPTNEATVSSSYWAVLVEWSSLEQVSSSQFSHPYRAALPRSVDRSRSRKKYNSARESQKLTMDVWQTLMTSTGPERDKTGKTIGKFKKMIGFNCGNLVDQQFVDESRNSCSKHVSHMNM